MSREARSRAAKPRETKRSRRWPKPAFTALEVRPPLPPQVPDRKLQKIVAQRGIKAAAPLLNVRNETYGMPLPRKGVHIAPGGCPGGSNNMEKNAEKVKWGGGIASSPARFAAEAKRHLGFAKQIRLKAAALPVRPKAGFGHRRLRLHLGKLRLPRFRSARPASAPRPPPCRLPGGGGSSLQARYARASGG